ncbi:predicted protein, partial [Nematostella vectensis]
MDEEDADLLQVDEEDELDEEFEKIKMAKMKSRKLKVLEEMALAEQTLVEAKAQLKKAEDHEPEPEPEPELTEADLPGLEADVLRLQEEYDEAVVHKHNLANEVKSCSERLKAATDLLH